MTDIDIVTALRAVLHNDRSVELMNREAADEIERLRAERDEARREVCARTLSEQAIMGFEKSTLEAIAAARSWDCLGPAELAKAVQTELYKGEG